MTRTFSATLFLLCAAATLAAHHSVSAEYDLTRTVEVKGVVMKVDWMNPHVLIHFDVTGQDGVAARWQAEVQAPAGALTRRGWSSTSVKAGDVIVATGFPVRQPKAGRPPTLSLVAVTLPDGTKLDGHSNVEWSPINVK